MDFFRIMKLKKVFIKEKKLLNHLLIGFCGIQSLEINI
jgi:hypothetical protein